MNSILNSPEFIPLIAFLLLGLSKSGFKGLGFFVVILLALEYEAKASTGILMPMLIFADCLAIYYYKKHVDWPILIKLLPPMVIGILIGVLIGENIEEELFKKLMAAIILVSGISMVLFDKIDHKKISGNKLFAWLVGLAAGFSTMVGNLAGGFANLYFLAIKLPKNTFIGTSAWLFFFVNLIKLPFHIFVWKSINSQSIVLSLKFIPMVIIGFLIGVYLIKYLSNAIFKKYIIIVTLLGAVLIYFK